MRALVTRDVLIYDYTVQRQLCKKYLYRIFVQDTIHLFVTVHPKNKKRPERCVREFYVSREQNDFQLDFDITREKI